MIEPIGKRDGQQTDTHGQTHGRTNIKFWGPSTQKALKGKNDFSKIETVSDMTSVLLIIEK